MRLRSVECNDRRRARTSTRRALVLCPVSSCDPATAERIVGRTVPVADDPARLRRHGAIQDGSAVGDDRALRRARRRSAAWRNVVGRAARRRAPGSGPAPVSVYVRRMDLELTDRRVVVTGGSKGIGRGIARTFLEEGAVVTICARGEDDLRATAEELSEFGVVHARTCDMAESGAPTEMIDWAAEQMGGIDVLVSNVSAMAGHDWALSTNVDLVRTEELIRAALEHMEDDTDANIVCIGSRAGNIGAPTLPAYAAVKAATVSMVKSLALELARRGIRANVISPGDILFPGGNWDHVRQNNEKLWDAMIKANPFRRMGTVDEIAATVAFVASRRSSFTTGANVMVDGGATGGLQL